MRLGVCPRAALVGLFALLTVAARVGFADEGPAASPAAAVDMTMEAVAQRKAKVQESAALDEAAKTRLIDLYDQVLRQLQLSAEWEARARQYAEAAAAAPAQLERIRAELAQPPAAATPEVDPSWSLAQVEQMAAQAESDLRAAEQALQTVEQEPKARAERRAQVPSLMAAARQALDEVYTQLSAPLGNVEGDEAAFAQRALLEARAAALENELHAYEEEIRSYDARTELLSARHDQAVQRLERAEAAARAWRALAADFRRQLAAQAAEQARAARREAANAHPLVRQLAEANTRLAERRTGAEGLGARIEALTARLQRVQETASALRAERAGLANRIQAGALSSAVGLLLRQKLDALPDPHQYWADIRSRQREAAEVQLELIELQEQRAALTRVDQLVAARMSELDPSLEPEAREEIERQARELLTTQRDLLDALLADLNTLFVRLVDLEAAERALVRDIRSYAQFIGEHVLWTRNSPAYRLGDVRQAAFTLGALVVSPAWGALAAALWRDIVSSPLLAAVLVPLFALLFLLRKRAVRTLRALGDAVEADMQNASFRQTIDAFLLTLFISAVLPALLLFLAWRLSISAGGGEFAKQTASALTQTALFLFPALVFLHVVSRRGLGETHFRWRERNMRLLRHCLRWYLPVAAAMVFIIGLTQSAAADSSLDALGRLTFVAGMLMMAWLAYRLLGRRDGLLEDLLRRRPDGLLESLRVVWQPLLILVPAAMAVLALSGYYYTAIQLIYRWSLTVLLVMAAVLVNALAKRWFVLAKSRLAMEKARKRKESEAGDARPAAPSAGGEISLAAIDQQTRKLLNSALLIGFVVGAWLIWSGMMPAFMFLERITLWEKTGQTAHTVVQDDGSSLVEMLPVTEPITLADLCSALLILIMTVILGKNIPGLLEITLLRRLPLDAGGGYAVTTVTRYAIMLVGSVTAVGTIGISWNNVQWLAAAFTVGVGFGLQEIIANFVSGLIILFERPIRVGDVVTVGDVSGKVTRIQIRATTITNWDRKDLIVPNKEFITGRLVNWTLTDSTLRLVLNVGVAYGSDVERVKTLLSTIAAGHPMVLDDPAPIVVFEEFADSALLFSLRVYLRNTDFVNVARTELNTVIEAAFRDAGIEIAYPQRDLHLRSVDAAAAQALRGGAAAPRGE